LIRSEISTWPDGSYTFTDYMDSDGVNGPAVTIKVTITIDGDSLTADFTGSSPQVAGAINSTRSFVISCVALCIRSVLKVPVPNTVGIFKPLNVITPPGTIVNVEMPGASTMRGVTGFRIVDAVFGALAGLLPDRVFAASEGGNSLIIIGGQDGHKNNYVFMELFSGTWGARPTRDGNDGLCNIANVASNIPVEQAECEYPIFINYYGFVTDSGGIGKYRGGLAIEREWTSLANEADLVIRSDRRDHPPYGLNGGGTGMPSMSYLYHKINGEYMSETLPVMISTKMQKGDRIYHRIAGGGGHGNPFERSIELIKDDILNGKVSKEAAQRDYGVVFDFKTGQIDIAATEAFRTQISQVNPCKIIRF
jgi:N-methylhydantoinase B/oxoprolinase/acetone carboxylase alpha subunit